MENYTPYSGGCKPFSGVKEKRIWPRIWRIRSVAAYFGSDLRAELLPAINLIDQQTDLCLSMASGLIQVISVA